MTRRARVIGIFATLAALLTPAVGTAQSPGRLDGRVTMSGAAQGVDGALVGLEGTPLSARTDSAGRYVIVGVTPGPHVLTVRRLGYAAARVPFTMPADGARTVDVELAVVALKLEQLIVTADRTGRARGELGTATVIDRDAIANQIASSLQGILELSPGVLLQPPGLDAAAQFSLRALATSGTSTAGAISGPGAADITSAGTLIILDGVPLTNNANMQSVGARGEVVPPASTAGGGVDLRRIPATVLERVEVIRGIPSARWGDLTQGAIVVDTRAAAAAPEFTGRYDPRTREGNVVGGRAFNTNTQALTFTLNFAQTAALRSLSSASTIRGASQVAHRVRFGTTPSRRIGADGQVEPRLTFDTRLDWFQLKYDSPERPDVEVGRNSYQNDVGLRLAERARWRLEKSAIELTLSFDGQNQYTRESRRLTRPTTPFTDRVTEGRSIGTYVEGLYLGEYELGGRPRMLYTRLEWDRFAPGAESRVTQLRAGLELRREWNSGPGYSFEIDRPPQASRFNGTRGYDRPRRFSDTDPLVTSAAYADARAAQTWGAWVAEAQAGLRASVLHDDGWWTSGARSSMLEPRLTAQLAPRDWVRVRAGAGVVSKLPTIGQLFPSTQYFDVVNVNRFTPDPAERLAVVTTFIRDPSNDNLGLSRGTKSEFGFELDGGARRGALSVTWFNDRVRDAVTIRREASSLPRDRYQLVDTATGSGQPGRIVDPPLYSEPAPIFLDRYVNGGSLDNRGIEFIAALPIVPALQTRIELSGARIQTTFSSSELDIGQPGSLADFQIDTAIKRVPYYGGATQRTTRSLVTWRVVHHQPELGLVITGTVQHRIGERRQVLTRADSGRFLGYINRSGEMIPVLAEDRDNPEYADLRENAPASRNTISETPDDWILSLQVVKSVFETGRLSFYVFNTLDRFLTFGGTGIRAAQSTRFGVELALPMSGLVDRWR